MTSATKDKPLSAQPRHGFLYFAAVASLSGLLFGYDTGVVSSALLFLKTQYHLSPAMQQGRADDAARAPTRLDGAGQVQAEIASIRRDLGGRGRPGGWADLVAPSLRPALLVGLAPAAFDQLTGINTIIYYTPTIFQMAGLGSAAHSILASVSVGLVNVAMTVVAVRLVDRVGRRPLLLWGLAGMIAGLALISLSFYLHGLGRLQGFLAAGSLILYVGAFAIGLGPVFWLLISEIYPLEVRGVAMSVATLTNWAFNLLVTASFLTLAHGLGLPWTFWGYGLVSVGAWFFVKRFVPETKGRSLEQIEKGYWSKVLV